jgi:hypothetical protein
MSEGGITAEALVAAFDLPPGPPLRRINKATLADNVPTAADKRLIDGKLARLDWVAAINPATSGIAAGEADGLAIQTVNLLLARTRGVLSARLAEIIHRAIPQPVVLIHADEAAEASAGLSLAPKRMAEREAGRVVLTGQHDTGPLDAADGPFVATLALGKLPSRDLAALYAALMERSEALAAARAGQRAFRLAAGMEELAQWREAVASCARLEGEIAGLTASLRKESRLARRVELGEAIASRKAQLDKCRAGLA